MLQTRCRVDNWSTIRCDGSGSSRAEAASHSGSYARQPAVPVPGALAPASHLLKASELGATPSRLRLLQECRRIVQAPGGGSDAARLLQEYRRLMHRRLDDEDVAGELVEPLIRESSTDAALSGLQLVRLTGPVLRVAAATFADKGSYRGVTAVHRLASERGMLRGRASSELWFALIAAYGALSRLDNARAAFRAARGEGAWAPANTHHTNVYLHALHTDVALVFVRARQLLDAGAAPDASTFNVLLKACMRSRDAQRADVAMEWMAAAGVAADSVTWSSLIKSHSYAGQFEGVLGVREAMAAAGFAPTPSVWGSLLVACGAAQQHETALMLWRELRSAAEAGAPLPAQLYNAMMTACNACVQGERTLTLLAEMKEAGGRPTATTYNLALKACDAPPGQRLRHGQLEMALALYGEMLAAGVQPDVFTYGTLMELCAEARQGARASELHLQMTARGVRANVVVLTSLIKALARSGMVPECLAVFQRMVWGPARARPDRGAFRSIIRELRRAGALGEALRVYQGMRRAGHAPNNREFQELIAAAAEAGLVQVDPELQAQVASLCRVTSLSEVDLHGMSRQEARAAVLCVLGLAMSEYQRSGGAVPAELALITGWGEHSEDGRAVLPGIVRRLVEDELHIAVGGEGKEGNSGRIVLGSAALEQWLQQRSAARLAKAEAVGGEL